MRKAALSLTLLSLLASCIPAWYVVMTLAWQTSLAETRMDLRISSEDRPAVTMTHESPNLSASGAVKDDSALVLAARAGDRGAFGGLYQRYARTVHGILLARVPSGDVDDLVQDVFLRALPRLASLRDVSRFGAWLSAIARNMANDYFRKTKPESAVTESLSEQDAPEPPARPTLHVSDSEAAMILAIVRSLSETYRETLILRLVEGMTGPEIAARTGLKPGSVRVNLHRGMQQLREKLKQSGHRAATLADRTEGP
jgi:RNA polymerase sigma-70 factor (ECF subfamily)